MRTSRWKVQYLVALAAMATGAYAMVRWMELGTASVVLVGLLLLVPGRLSGFLWRELYRGRRLQQSESLDGAVTEYRAFLAKLERHPWLRRVWWLAWAAYTRDPKAMALNNLGGCLLELGHVGQAEECLRQAVAIDPLYPVPHVNLAELEAKRGNAVAAAANRLLTN